MPSIAMDSTQEKSKETIDSSPLKVDDFDFSRRLQIKPRVFNIDHTSIQEPERSSRVMDHPENVFPPGIRSGLNTPKAFNYVESHDSHLILAEGLEALSRSLVYFRGQPVGTIAALDHSDEALNYNQGIYGYPIAIQALFFMALRCALLLLVQDDEGKELAERISKRLHALSYHLRSYFWLDFHQLNDIYRTRFSRADFIVHDGRKHSFNSTPAIHAAPHSSSGNIANDHDINLSVRIFVDATFSATRCTYGIVVVDLMGNFIEALSGPSVALSVVQAELSTILEALRLIATRCFTAVSLFTDSMLSVTYLNSQSSTWPWSIQRTLLVCHSLWLHSCTTIAHTPRSFNLMAHILAQHADSTLPATIESTIPRCIEDFFQDPLIENSIYPGSPF